MPLYEFSCQGCQQKFEELCSLAAADQMCCPACGQPAKRQISGFAFKSSGGTFRSSIHGDGGCTNCGSGSCSTCSH